jgi:hypothetical protein
LDAVLEMELGQHAGDVVRDCWFLVAAGDQAIPPDAERGFAKRMEATTVEVPSNTWRWSPTPMTSSASSRPPPMPWRALLKPWQSEPKSAFGRG